MRKILCDLCKEEIKKGPANQESVEVRLGWRSCIELCLKCAKPIASFLQKKKLVTKLGIESGK